MNIITLNRVLLNNTPLNYRRKRILTEKDFYFKTIERTFTFSKSAGGKSIKDGRAYIKRIKGNSVVWNQGFPDTYPTQVFKNRVDVVASERLYTCTVNSIAYTFVGFYFNREQISIIPTHKYLVSYVYKGGKNAILQGGIDFQKGEVSANANIATQFAYIDTANNGTLSFVMNTIIESMEVGDTFTVSDIKVIDLTQMFQAGNEPTTIEDFNARVATLGVDMNAYNGGEVIHMNTESIKSVGDNAWDEEWEVGAFYSHGGYDNSADTIRTKGYVRVLPNAEYYVVKGEVGMGGFLFAYDKNHQQIEGFSLYGSKKTFVTPSNASYVRFSFASNYGRQYKHDAMLTLVHSGWKQDTDAGYQPYWQDILPLPIIRKYFPQGMKSTGTAHDEIRFNKASGKWEYSKSKAGGGKIKSVDLGTLNWSLNASYGFFASVPSDMVVGNLNYLTERSYTKYANPDRITWEGIDKAITNGLATIGTSWVRNLVIKDSAYTDAATFKADMAGVMLYYESNDWEWVELDAEDQNFRDYYQVADFGTEMSQSEVPSAALLADVGYYFKKSEVKELTLN